MPKKKEPTSTPVNKDPKKTTKPTTAAAAATPAASVTPAKAEAPKPAATAAPTAPAKAEAPKPAATAATAKAETTAKAEAPKPAATAAPPAKAEAPKPAAKPASPKAPKAPKAPASPAKATATAKKSIDSTATVVVAKYDVGFGNKLFIRGEGAGLSWETGVEMKNVENDVWVWTNNDLKKGAVACKFLINDDVWSTGENLFVPAGETSTVFPNF